MSNPGRVIETCEDIQVGRPLPRETIRGTREGVLVTCNEMHCNWQGIFPDADLATDAAESHYEHELRNGEYYFGRRSYYVVALLDGENAMTLDASELGPDVESLRLRAGDGSVRELAFPRTTGDVATLVERGDLIEKPNGRHGLVASVTETRSLGVPTWTVVYVEPEKDLTSLVPRRDYKWLNESIARDGDVYRRYGSDQLTTPRFEVIGRGEHQADFSEFGPADGGRV